MEYFQIADMFGKRRHPQLHILREEGRYRCDGPAYERELTVGIENTAFAPAE